MLSAGHTTNFATISFALLCKNQQTVFFAAMNVLARVTTKDVANCDTHCELRSSGNQQKVERKRRLGLPRGVSGSVFKIFRGSRSTLNAAPVCALTTPGRRGRVKCSRLGQSGRLHFGFSSPLGALLFRAAPLHGAVGYRDPLSLNPISDAVTRRI